jgi:hypothetical protein
MVRKGSRVRVSFRALVGAGRSIALAVAVGAAKISRRLGTFTGTISFTGENGYTSVERTSAAGTVGTSPFRSCTTRHPHRSGRAATEKSARNAVLSLHGRDGAPTLLAIGNGRSADFNAFSGEMIDAVPVLRIAHVSAAGASFASDDAGTAATLKPPAPFSGSGTFRARRRRHRTGAVTSASSSPASTCR